ncbi:MAG: carboxypeptidase-like regulatory domain-containing protein [Terriglobia bacterium]
MYSTQRTRLFWAAWVITSFLLFASLSRAAQAQGGDSSSQTVNMIVMVKDAESGQPVSQAHVTLQFPEKPGKKKTITYNAKSDTQGRCKLVGINKGSVVLMVTADGHQTYGKELQLEKNNQVFEVKLKKPQPLI